jgi:hypothetical protein
MPPKTGTLKLLFCLRFIIFDHPDELSSSTHSSSLCNRFCRGVSPRLFGQRVQRRRDGHAASALRITHLDAISEYWRNWGSRLLHRGVVFGHLALSALFACLASLPRTGETAHSRLPERRPKAAPGRRIIIYISLFNRPQSIVARPRRLFFTWISPLLSIAFTRQLGLLSEW